MLSVPRVRIVAGRQGADVRAAARRRSRRTRRPRPAPTPLEPFTHGGPRRWPEVLKTQAIIGRDDGPFAVDVLTVPDNNPWLCQMRPSGFDFLPDGQTRRGLHLGRRRLAGRRGRRAGAGTHLAADRLGAVPAAGAEDRRRADLRRLPRPDRLPPRPQRRRRDRLLRVLQQRPPGHRALPRVRDGPADRRRGELLLRQGGAARPEGGGAAARHAAAGRQGRRADRDPGDRLPRPQRRLPQPRRHLLPHRPGRVLDCPRTGSTGSSGAGFYGNMWGYHDVTDTSDDAMEPPVCWITNAFDRSPAELVRVESTHPAWAPLRGSLLNLSYGNGKVFVVPHEVVGGRMQGGMCALPIAAVPDRRHAGPVPSGRRPALHLRPVRLGRRPDPARRLLPRPRHRQADVRAGRPARPEGRHGDHVHRTGSTARPPATRRTTRPGPGR